MKTRWYISTFFICLTIIGAVYQQQISLPNQEIIVEFTDVDVSSDQVKSTIAAVKKHLYAIGVDNINVKDGKQGRLKITYYSDTDVASIKKILSKEKKIALNYSAFNQDDQSNKLPSDENSSNYNLAIHEIQINNDLEWDLDGTFVLEFRSESDRFYNPNIYGNSIEIDPGLSLDNISYKVNRNSASAIDKASHKMPEVRAGPSSYGIPVFSS